jgi:phosphoglycolate phosphatase-like HAD superfamily hydrolase
MEPALILFDIDGTLVDTAGAGRLALVEVFRTLYDVDGDVEASRRVRFEGKTDPVIVVELARVFGVDEREVTGRTAEFERVYLEILQSILSRPEPERRILPGVVTLLDAIEALPHATLGLLTGNIEAGGRTKLAAFDLNRYFPDGGFASDHHDRAAIARLAHEKMERHTGLSFAASRTTVVGDTEHDIACARANNFRAVAVSSGWAPRDRLVAAAPDALFDDFLDTDAVLDALGLA